MKGTRDGTLSCVAGEATFALTIKGELPVTVPSGFGLKAQIEGEDKPVEFETRAALSAHPALGKSWQSKCGA